MHSTLTRAARYFDLRSYCSPNNWKPVHLLLKMSGSRCRHIIVCRHLYCHEDDINEFIKINNLCVDEFSLLHLNVWSLPKNISKLCSFLSLIDNKLTVVGLSETWLHSDTIGLYKVPEYTSVTLLRHLTKEGVYHYVYLVHLNILKCYQKSW